MTKHRLRGSHPLWKALCTSCSD